MARLTTKHTKENRGLSLVEALLYSALLFVLLFVMVNVLIFVIKSYRQIIATKTIQASAITSLERLGQEVRRAKTIDPSTTATSLVLNTTDSSGNNETVSFILLDGGLHFYEAGVDQGSLTSPEATVSSLLFQTITAGSNSAVRISETIESGSSGAFRSENFYSTIELRQ